ncbi:unnamed protein product [Paramecium sonneborni]|uniref:Uncharacterized protein n=1 Tax=Paramecium sonneborni TaxID=65129 RepID=A0A8S1R7J5_9CILI|nr:unnamed protein product [Paramecium sonneborni]
MSNQENIKVSKILLQIMFFKNSKNQNLQCNQLFNTLKQRIHFQDIFLKYKNNKKHLLI